MVLKVKSYRLICILTGAFFVLLTAFSSYADSPKKIIVLGDSLSTAYGINAQQSWVYILAAQLAQSNPDYQVIDASVSGDTTESGLNRLATIINNNQPDIHIMIIALGTNDGIKSIHPDTIKSNLGSMIALCQQNNIRVLLVGMYMPLNYGDSYISAMRKAYQDLTIEYKVRQIPFMLANVATNPNLLQEDGLHPTAEAQAAIFRNIWMGLRPMLREQ